MPVYFRGDSTLLDNQKNTKEFFKTIFLKWLYRHVDHAFYVGANNKAYFEKYGLKNEQLSFAPHAVDNNRFGEERTAEISEFRTELGIENDHLMVLFAGKLEEKKSPMLLLKAFLRLKKPKIHLIFAGDGPLMPELRNNAADHKNIHFIGFKNQTHMPVIYQSCDIFCLPSKGPGETWGLAVNEAMACGKPVLVSDKCGCAIDLVTKGNGVIFNSESEAELASGIEYLLLNEDLRTQFGDRSKAMISYWNFDRIAKAIEAKLSGEFI